jgi:hypothetical protein
MNNFRSVESLIDMARDENQMIYITIPIMLEYDRIVLTITNASANMAKPGMLILRKYFSPIIEDDPDGFSVPIDLTAEETALLTKKEYDYMIILEHLGNRVGEYLNVRTFNFRHLASLGKLLIKD